MRIAVLGPAGFGGSHICLELLQRGHEVVGVSRNPEKLGKHERYKPLSLDISAASVAELVDLFKKTKVESLVNAVNPQYTPTVYRSFVETVRKLVLAFKAARMSHFINIGGTASLSLPCPPETETLRTAGDSRAFWLAYRRGVADSEANTSHMEDRIGHGNPMSKAMRDYRSARVALKAGRASDEDRQTIHEAEQAVLHGSDPVPDIPLAARASFMFFEDNTSFEWTFVSPPAQYRPGPRTGKYEVVFDEVPLKPLPDTPSVDGNPYEGRLLGISVADLAVAIADEVETKTKVGRHWSPVADLPTDEAMNSFATVSG